MGSVGFSKSGSKSYLNDGRSSPTRSPGLRGKSKSPQGKNDDFSRVIKSTKVKSVNQMLRPISATMGNNTLQNSLPDIQESLSLREKRNHKILLTHAGI